MGIKNFLQDILGKKEIHLDPSSLDENKVNKALQFAYVEEKAKVDKLKKEIAKLRNSSEDQKEEEEIKLVLNQKKQELEHINTTKYFSLGEFFRRYLSDKNLQRKIYFTDFERGEKIDQFKDIGFSEDGQIVIVGKENNVIMKMERLKDIFQSVRGLSNDVLSGKVPLNLDRDGAWIENVMDYEVPQIQRNGMGLQYYKARKRPVYEIITDKNKVIARLQSELEDQEELNSELMQEMDNLKRGLRLQEGNSEIMATDISKMEKSSSSMMKAMNSITNRLEEQQNLNIILEDNLEKLENQIEKMRDEAEREGIKLSDDKALETVKQIRRELVRDEPSKEVRIIKEGQS